jgi:hypothetical protein
MTLSAQSRRAPEEVPPNGRKIVHLSDAGGWDGVSIRAAAKKLVYFGRLEIREKEVFDRLFGRADFYYVQFI